MHRLSISFLALSLLAIALPGCNQGGGFSAVTGTVTFDGKPIKVGTITFESVATDSAGGSRMIMTRIRDGKYKFESTDGPAPGQHKVAVKAFNEAVAEDTAPAGKNNKQTPTRETGNVEPENYIPPQFNTETTLTVDVTAGLNENVDFSLKP